MSQGTFDGANVRFPPPLVYAAGLLVGIAVERFLHVPRLGLAPPLRDLLGATGLLAGVAISAASVSLFKRRGTAIIPYKPATALVTTGIYKWTRNPMYLGLALLYVGTSLLLNSLAALMLLPFVLAIIQSQVIYREEAYLRRAFGSEYADYERQVRMWI
jgi:protein-S-isoprenylcysteine O-methyltransferase Ste14